LPQDVSQPEQGVLARGIERRAGVSDAEAVLRTGVENVRRHPLVGESPAEGRAAVPGPHQVDLENPAGVPLIDVDGAPDRRKYAGVVDGNVDVAEGRPSPPGPRPHG